MSTLDSTISMMQLLSDSDIKAVQGIVQALYAKNEATSEIYEPQTEAQLLKRIDASLDDIKNGLYEDADKVENDLRKEFAL